MGRSLPIRIAGVVFSSLGQATVHCRRILNEAPIGGRICGADAEFVEHLWLNRPDKLEAFAGRRVVGFECRYRAGRENWTLCFWAVFEDGGAVDFSYQKALSFIVASQHPQR